MTGPEAVRAWAEPVVIPTYPVMPADRNPMFLDKRVYQGSSGRVYPNRIVDRVSDDRRDATWQALHLENEFVRLMILPEIGGRIHVAQDRTNGYDFIYRQRVIKPALVGLLGPWISGGIEFNWPQHHRPSTYMPVAWAIEEEPDGSRTVWLGEHEPMQRMKGMVGIRLRPGSSVVEARARLANRTPHAQSFLWWANVAVRVHDRYQSFFAPDVRAVVDHARRAVSTFPVANGTYYGVDYGSRPAEQADLSWYANIPVPTSYMAVGSQADFHGGYDHEARAGIVHVADHGISPGKKQWTWGNAPFGRAWERNLTDEDGPYIELMSGVYTDNQPDFSWLAPYETRTFEQRWYPIREIGPALAATADAAVSLAVEAGRARIGVHATRRFPHARLMLHGPSGVLVELVRDLAPDAPFTSEVRLPTGVRTWDLHLVVETADGRVLVEGRHPAPAEPVVPAAAVEPPPPAAIATMEELYLTGLHLEQYRHATRSPEPYWREALRRDPGDSRAACALAVRLLRQGHLVEPERLLRRAIGRLTRLNPNPADGEPHYQLGVCLQLGGRLAEAEDAYAKAAWTRAWAAPASYALAQLRGRAGDLEAALVRTDEARMADPRHATAGVLRAVLLRRLGRSTEALAALEAILAADPLDEWARVERELARVAVPGDGGREAHTRAPAVPRDDQTALDVAHDYAAAGFVDDAVAVLLAAAEREPRTAPSQPSTGRDPMVEYTLGWLLVRQGDPAGALEHDRRGAAMPADGCFPSRLVEIEILRAAQHAVPEDARSPYYLGNLYYDRGRHAEAIACWKRSARLDPTFATVHRNLGIAQANVMGRPAAARRSFLRAFALDPSDGRVLYELDQLLKRQNADPAARLARLQAHLARVDERDDLGVEYAVLLEQVDRPADARRYLAGRRFHPWEGGEGRVLDAWVTACLRLARSAIASGAVDDAVAHAREALEPPETLGEARHPLAPEHEILYVLGCALASAGDRAGTARVWARAAEPVHPDAALSDATYFRARALEALQDRDAPATFRQLLRDARRQARRSVGIDYFATSLPTFLVFNDDLDRRNRIECRYLEGLALGGLGRTREALRALRDVLAMDRNHVGARQALRSLDPPPGIGRPASGAQATAAPRSVKA